MYLIIFENFIDLVGVCICMKRLFIFLNRSFVFFLFGLNRFCVVFEWELNVKYILFVFLIKNVFFVKYMKYFFVFVKVICKVLYNGYVLKFCIVGFFI